jgi:hypothetical protein
MYYLYCYDDAGTLTLELSTTGPNTAYRPLRKNEDDTRLLLAYCYADASGNIVDYLNDASTHLINNLFNKRLIPLKALDATDSWTYNSSTIRQARATATNKVCFVADGVNAVKSECSCWAYCPANQVDSVGIGLDRTNGFDSVIANPGTYPAGIHHAWFVFYKGIPSAGYHYLSWNESVVNNGGANATYYGDGGALSTPGVFSGIIAEIWA